MTTGRINQIAIGHETHRTPKALTRRVKRRGHNTLPRLNALQRERPRRLAAKHRRPEPNKHLDRGRHREHTRATTLHAALASLHRVRGVSGRAFGRRRHESQRKHASTALLRRPRHTRGIAACASPNYGASKRLPSSARHVVHEARRLAATYRPALTIRRSTSLAGPTSQDCTDSVSARYLRDHEHRVLRL